MNITNTYIQGVYILDNFKSTDERGSFTKIYNSQTFEKLRLLLDIKETYYSISNKNVIRGLHFQTPPYEQDKLVTVIKGSVQDVIVDLRKNSKTYGKYVVYELSEKTNKAILIPKGCAHGFKSLKDGTIMLYMVSTVYDKEHDSGIKWNSIEFDWNIKNPIISERDNNFIKLQDFNSPF